eukprot:GHRR01004625.1.p2 GENE.GHRR01004625.1~~GHRR01004625.1.p2  ORF type:complete len:119 (-),score=8.17 GHRR01004625.1:477-833(-)
MLDLCTCAAWVPPNSSTYCWLIKGCPDLHLVTKELHSLDCKVDKQLDVLCFCPATQLIEPLGLCKVVQRNIKGHATLHQRIKDSPIPEFQECNHCLLAQLVVMKHSEWELRRQQQARC